MRRKYCKDCGAIFETDRKAKYLCDACSKRAKQDSVVRNRECIQCGTLFPGGPRASYCPTCRQRRQLENNRKSQRCRRTGGGRALGSTDICVRCGQPYTVKSGLQRYCPECAPAATAERIRAHKVAVYAERKDELNDKRKERRKPYKTCVICGKAYNNGDPAITCSTECAYEYKKRVWDDADYKRGRRHLK